MRYLVIVVLILFSRHLKAQYSFAGYTDSINLFSINIPVGWKYGVPKAYPTIKIIAYRAPVSPTDTSKDNFNINIFESPGSSLEKTYKEFVETLKESSATMQEEGEAVLNGKRFKWLIESHSNSRASTKISTHNYDFVAYQNNKTYILTMVTFSIDFPERRKMFKVIADSFNLK